MKKKLLQRNIGDHTCIAYLYSENKIVCTVDGETIDLGIKLATRELNVDRTLAIECILKAAYQNKIANDTLSKMNISEDSNKQIMNETLTYLMAHEKVGTTPDKEKLANALQNMITVSSSAVDGGHIVYFITEDIAGKLNKIDIMYERVNADINEEESILIDAYHSATIEGAMTTVENVVKAFSNPTEEDEMMVVNTVKALKEVYSQGINEDNIRKIWEITVDGVCGNTSVMGEKYRNGQVYIGGVCMPVHTPPDYRKVPYLMDELFKYIENSRDNIWVKASVAQFLFVFIHPFCDGNGRVGRMITQHVLNSSGKNKIRTVEISKSINENLSSYYKALRESEDVYGGKQKFMGITPFIDYMLDSILRALVDASARSRKMSSIQSVILKKMKKHGAGTEITVKKAMEITKAGYGPTLKGLNELCIIGYLEKRTEHGKNIYRLK